MARLGLAMRLGFVGADPAQVIAFALSSRHDAKLAPQLPNRPPPYLDRLRDLRAGSHKLSASHTGPRLAMTARRGRTKSALETGKVVCHDFVIGELALRPPPRAPRS